MLGKLVARGRAVRLAELQAFPHDGSPELMALITAHMVANPELDLFEAAKIAAWGVAPISGGAVDQAEVMLGNTPIGAPFDVNPSLFYERTKEGFLLHTSFAFNAGVQWTAVGMPQVGIYGKTVLQFVGTLTQTTASGTTTAAWPYGIANNVRFTANGQDDVFGCDGMALKALERTRHPYLDTFNDDLTGPGIGSGLTVSTGTTNLRLTFEIPHAFDEASLLAGLFAQSKSVTIQLNGRDAAVADLVTNSTGTTAIAGTWYVGILLYKIPVGPDGRLVLPDVRFMHGFNQIETQFNGTGDVKTAITRTSGWLQRLFIQDVNTFGPPITFYDPYSFNQTDVAEYRLEFGAQEKPYIYPQAFLGSDNVRSLGDKLPYRYVVFDFARDNPARDVIHLSGVTELYAIAKIVAAPGAGARQRVTQEVLFGV